MIKDLEKWNKEIEDSKDFDYGAAIVKVAGEVMRLLDKTENNVVGEEQFLNAHELILQADKNLQEHITGNQAGYVAYLVVKYHSRGEDFKRSWNKFFGDEKRKGVINPAIITIG
jgi:hypothetical protein